MTKTPLVLVIEDEPTLRQALRADLESWGYACEEASTGDAGLSLVASWGPDLVILDLGLPDGDGTALVPRLRQGKTAVLVLSARGQEAEKVRALEAGADDYLIKPHSPAELRARVRAVLRRTGTPEAVPVQTWGDLRWDAEARRVFRGADEVHLTPVEYRLFAALAHRPGQILTHRTLLEEVWGRTSDEFLHYVRIAVAGLRRKLEPPGAAPVLHTEVGVGYRLFERD